VAPGALVVVGASAGGVEALRALVARLPSELDAAVLVVLHIPRGAQSVLPAILSRSATMPAAHAVDGESLESGRIYVAPVDHHLLVLDGRVRLSRGPTENGHRPAVDPLFRSAARAYGPRVIGIVLSGSLDDGTAGAAVVVNRGGRLLVQDPEDALHASMPRSALVNIGAERVLPAHELGPAVAELLKSQADSGKTERTDADDDLVALETAMANLEDLTAEDLPAQPSGLGCPSCHGALFELPGVPVPRYRCRVGHAWSPESLIDEQAEALDGALWTALRSLEEKAALCRRMAAMSRNRGSTSMATRYEGRSVEAEEAARQIRKLIFQGPVIRGETAADLG
jgi:two-component system, chemotaxis family, protein-glutamate methylesterase/glutaminase